MGRVEAKLILSLLYETQYGIYDHTNTGGNRPMAGVAYHPAYDTYAESLLNDLAFRYEENGIWDVFHISFDAYINKPRIYTLQLDDQARQIKQRRDERLRVDASKAEQRFKNELGGGSTF